MIIEIETGRRIQRVRLEPAGRSAHCFRVTVGDRTQIVDARRVDSTRLSLLVEDPATSREQVSSHEADLLQLDGGELEVYVRGAVVRATLNGRHRATATRGLAAEASGPIQVAAPMPGRVVRVLVAVGEDVQEGQGLVVVEAMKMENAVVAPIAGRVTEVTAREGMSVEGGRALVVIEGPGEARLPS